MDDQVDKKDIYYRPKEFRKHVPALNSRRSVDLKLNAQKWREEPSCKTPRIGGYLFLMAVAAMGGMLGGIYWFVFARPSYLAFAKFIYDLHN